MVVPIYNEQDTLPELGQRLEAVCNGLSGIQCQVIYVNDGSQDDSLQIMLGQSRANPIFTIVDLSRNFGQHAAISAGLAHADADAVVIMDADLQDPPELIPELLDSWRSGAQVVHAVRRTRTERGLRGLAFASFHKVFCWCSDFKMTENTGVFGLLDRVVTNEFNALPERNRFIPGLRMWIGFEQRKVFYDRESRASGQPKQTIGRLVHLAMDGIFSFSHKPLRLMTLMGICISVAGFFLASLFVLKRLFGWESAQAGFTTLAILILFLGGIQLMAVGLLGEYLGRVYDETKQRPLFIVKQRFGLDTLNWQN